jgi:hypothetical protein
LANKHGHQEQFFFLIGYCYKNPSLDPFGQAVSEEKIFLTLVNQKQELLLAVIFVGQTERNPFSDWLLFKKSPLKLHGQMEPNLAESIYVRSSIKFLQKLLLAAMFIGRMEPNEEAL